MARTAHRKVLAESRARRKAKQARRERAWLDQLAAEANEASVNIKSRKTHTSK